MYNFIHKVVSIKWVVRLLTKYKNVKVYASLLSNIYVSVQNNMSYVFMRELLIINLGSPARRQESQQKLLSHPSHYIEENMDVVAHILLLTFCLGVIN